MSNVLLGTAVGDALGVPFETIALCNNPIIADYIRFKLNGESKILEKKGKQEDII